MTMALVNFSRRNTISHKNQKEVYDLEYNIGNIPNSCNKFGMRASDHLVEHLHYGIDWPIVRVDLMNASLVS